MAVDFHAQTGPTPADWRVVAVGVKIGTVNRLRKIRTADPTVGPFKTAKFTPLQAASLGLPQKKKVVAYIHGKPVRRVSQLPGLPMPRKVQVFRGGVAFDDVVLLPFPFPDALHSWLASQASSWVNADGSEERMGRVWLILEEIELAYLRFTGAEG